MREKRSLHDCTLHKWATQKGPGRGDAAKGGNVRLDKAHLVGERHCESEVSGAPCWVSSDTGLQRSNSLNLLLVFRLIQAKQLPPVWDCAILLDRSLCPENGRRQRTSVPDPREVTQE